MPISQITPEKWLPKTPDEKERIIAEVVRLSGDFLTSGRRETWHVSPFLKTLQQKDGIPDFLKQGGGLFVWEKNGRVSGITLFRPSSERKGWLEIALLLTRTGEERRRIGRQLFAAAVSYARAKKYKGAYAKGQSESGKDFIINVSSLFPRRNIRGKESLAREHATLIPGRGVVELQISFEKRQTPSIPRKKPWYARLFGRRR